MFMNLISNTGIHYFTFPISFDNTSLKMHFHEWFDIGNERRQLEIAHFFPDEELWLKKKDLANLGFVNDGVVGVMDKGKPKVYSWSEIKQDFINEGFNQINYEETEDGIANCSTLSINKIYISKFINNWLPFPLFYLGSNGKSQFGPTNWCRIKILENQENAGAKYNVLVAIDTLTNFEDDNFEDDDRVESPVFSSNFISKKEFKACENDFMLVDFCSKAKKCEWIDDYILKLFHNVSDFSELKGVNKNLGYLAQFIFLLKYIQNEKILNSLTLFSDKNVEQKDVDIVLDMGNSRTFAALIENQDFSKVEPLNIFNFTTAVKNGKLNISNQAFDMRLAFREVSFGKGLIEGSSQFIYPSFVRLGEEALSLIYNSKESNDGLEAYNNFSSPKRFLWDNEVSNFEWEFISINDENAQKPIWLKGLSEQLNSDGSINLDYTGGSTNRFSKNALMTFCFIEILAQARIQINSYEYRQKWGDINKPRKINKIIITCPTAMSRTEQIALRQSAVDAEIVLNRFFKKNYNKVTDIKAARKAVNVIPNLANLANLEAEKQWIFDEATSAQFLYMYAELNKRYQNNINDYFEFYGNVRKDLSNDKSIVVASVDIGAGTTDVMISAYKSKSKNQCTISPIPLYGESFYLAGDDILKDLISNLIIEGENGTIKKILNQRGIQNSSEKIFDFFGDDNNIKSVANRKIRSEFNTQVSVPIINRYLEIMRVNKVKQMNLSFTDIFTDNIPSKKICNSFFSHFGVSLESIVWEFDFEMMCKIIKNKFDYLVSIISSLVSYHKCDILLLSGRPTSLKPIYDLFLKYYPVPANRMISLNNYRVGRWYPFQDGNGFFKDPKSIVAMGALIGCYSSGGISLNGFSIDLAELVNKMSPSTNYFAVSAKDIAFITPAVNNTKVEISQLPFRIWTRQLEPIQYPSRPFYTLGWNVEKIKEKIRQRLIDIDSQEELKYELDKQMEKLKNQMPFIVTLYRENFILDKESLKIESIYGKDGTELPINYFKLHIQSMSELENYWLDSGVFNNLEIKN